MDNKCVYYVLPYGPVLVPLRGILKSCVPVWDAGVAVHAG